MQVRRCNKKSPFVRPRKSSYTLHNLNRLSDFVSAIRCKLQGPLLTVAAILIQSPQLFRRGSRYIVHSDLLFASPQTSGIVNPRRFSSPIVLAFDRFYFVLCRRKLAVFVCANNNGSVRMLFLISCPNISFEISEGIKYRVGCCNSLLLYRNVLLAVSINQVAK